MSEGLIIDPGELAKIDLDDEVQSEKFNEISKKGIQSTVPYQAVIGATQEAQKYRYKKRNHQAEVDVEKTRMVYVMIDKPFRRQFYILYQLPKDVAAVTHMYLR